MIRSSASIAKLCHLNEAHWGPASENRSRGRRSEGSAFRATSIHGKMGCPIHAKLLSHGWESTNLSRRRHPERSRGSAVAFAKRNQSVAHVSAPALGQKQLSSACRWRLFATHVFTGGCKLKSFACNFPQIRIIEHKAWNTPIIKVCLLNIHGELSHLNPLLRGFCG